LALKTGSNLEASPRVPLFQTDTQQPISTMAAFFYDVAGDGQGFLINTRLDEPNPVVSKNSGAMVLGLES
jgi:hypothetical protein